jgi:diguanylate cyclase (GGDEF)-like protein/PAS domain S-box-containing protein
MHASLAGRIKAKLSALYGASIFGAMLLVVCGGLVIPALIGGYVLIGVRERDAAQASLQDTLQRHADFLAVGLREPVWNLDFNASRLLVDSVLRDPSVVRVSVTTLGPGNGAPSVAIAAQAPSRPLGQVVRAEREIRMRGQHIGQVLLEMDDARSQRDLHDKQFSYAFVLAFQVLVSLGLIVLFLNRRLLVPLRRLTAFSDRLSHGDFDTPLELAARDELGRLGNQMEQMREAIRHLFEDIGRREERFRTIVTQVPGAVFRVQPGGRVDFVSSTIEDICGYPAALFLRSSSSLWSDIISPEDRRMQGRTIRAAMESGRPYEIEYRILDAFGTERWVLENGQPLPGPDGATVWIDGIISDISERKHNEVRIEALLAEQSAILDNVMFGVMFVRNRRIVSANRRCEELFGYTPGELAGESTAILFNSDEEFEAVSERQYAALEAGQDWSEERRYRRRDGTLFWGMVSGCALDPGRVHNGSIWVVADVTVRRQAEEELRLSATVLEHIADGVMVIGTDGRIVAVNPAFTQITGYSKAEVLGQAWCQAGQGSTGSPMQHGADLHGRMWDELVRCGFWRGELWNRRRNGEPYLEWRTVSAVRDERGRVTHYVGVFSDITRIKQSQEQLDHLAHHDALTQLPNRLLFQDRVQHALQRAMRSHEQLAILFIDLDRFKNVNDTLGHHVGDELLKQVAAALRARLREGDTLARLGGDEFIVLLEQVDGAGDAAQVADKLVGLFEHPFIVSDYELFVGASVGISLYPNDAQDLHMLIRNADVAMYQVKARGRNGYQFYQPSMSGDGVERLRLEALLRRSIEKQEIYLEYQPQVDLASGRLLGVEALVRWRSPELGAVPPMRFIPLAEDIGYISQLGNWVLVEACRQMVRWQAQGLHVPKLAVNLSAKQLERGGIAERVAAILADTGLEAARLQLEVTESVIMNSGDALIFVNDLHKVGVGLAIDDFGTGYSSLAYLKQMPVQTLKIDRSFIKDISTDANDEAITVAIIQLGKSLNLSVIAEGVESEEQAAFLRRHGCGMAQGYLYGRPAAPGALLAQWTAEPERRAAGGA